MGTINTDCYKKDIKDMIDKIDNLQFLIRIYSFVKSKFDRETGEKGV